MKLILKEYLASLRERGDLDKSVLPNLLAQIGLNVLNIPMIGTRQNGVDIAAVGKIRGEDKRRYLYLFCIKAGNITRSDWEVSKQSVRPELNEIRDVYLNANVAKEHEDLPVKICLCCGGEIEETVLINWAGYTKRYTTDQITYENWNGDKLADLMMRSLLARELLEEKYRNDFQKAVAMVNEPAACYAYANEFLRGLLIGLDGCSQKDQLLKLRQAYICLNAITTWAIEAKNLESIYQISELGMLLCWHAVRNSLPSDKKSTKFQRSLQALFEQFLKLHLGCSELYLAKTAFAHGEKLHALSISVGSREALDVNLSMFELLGRVAINGIWAATLARNHVDTDTEIVKRMTECAKRSLDTLVALINNNPTLNSPFKDDHMIEIALVMYLAQVMNSAHRFLPWLSNVGEKTTFALLSNSNYPAASRDYNDLLNHPMSSDDDFRAEACSGSVLYPYLFVYLANTGSAEEVQGYCSRLKKMLPNCTYQAWLPDEDTEDLIWQSETYHGVSVTGLSPQIGINEITNILNLAISKCPDINSISAIRIGLEAMFLAACRHHRLPIPPHFWISRQDDELEIP